MNKYIRFVVAIFIVVVMTNFWQGCREMTSPVEPDGGPPMPPLPMNYQGNVKDFMDPASQRNFDQASSLGFIPSFANPRGKNPGEPMSIIGDIWRVSPDPNDPTKLQEIWITSVSSNQVVTDFKDTVKANYYGSIVYVYRFEGRNGGIQYTLTNLYASYGNQRIKIRDWIKPFGAPYQDLGIFMRIRLVGGVLKSDPATNGNGDPYEMFTYRLRYYGKNRGSNDMATWDMHQKTSPDYVRSTNQRSPTFYNANPYWDGVISVGLANTREIVEFTKHYDVVVDDSLVAYDFRDSDGYQIWSLPNQIVIRTRLSWTAPYILQEAGIYEANCFKITKNTNQVWSYDNHDNRPKGSGSGIDTSIVIGGKPNRLPTNYILGISSQGLFNPAVLRIAKQTNNYFR